jgi:tetratricopeptide (TPR) repeat protein
MENHSVAEINSRVDKISSLRKEKRYGDAASLIDESLTRYPRSVELLDERGWWYLEQEQYLEALEAFEKALAAARWPATRKAPRPTTTPTPRITRKSRAPWRPGSTPASPA